jgi:hypothetical protein
MFGTLADVPAVRSAAPSASSGLPLPGPVHPAVPRGDGAALARAAERAKPVALAAEHVLPVLPALVPLFPDGGLRRGTTLAVGGAAATSLALAVAAGPSGDGSWVGVVGMPSLGLLAAAELGVALDRLVLVAPPEDSGPDAWVSVLATLVDGMDVVLAAVPRGARLGDARRLSARVRERGAVLVLVDEARQGAAGGIGPFEPELRLRGADVAWEGLEPGAGHLRARRLVVEAGGRRAAARPRRAALWLPDADGQVRTDDSAGTVVPLRGVG